MSYTQLNKEIEKYYKQQGKSFTFNALTESEEEKEARNKEYKSARDHIVEKWQKEKKYKELISCTHGRWFPYDEFTKPLAEYFIKNNEPLLLKVLCEREIRFKIEDMLKSMKHVKDDAPKTSVEEILAYDLDEYLKSKSYHPIGELCKWRTKSLQVLHRYIELLEQTEEHSYLKTIEEINEKVKNLTIKKADLKQIKHKIRP